MQLSMDIDGGTVSGPVKSMASGSSRGSVIVDRAIVAATLFGECSEASRDDLIKLGFNDPDQILAATDGDTDIICTGFKISGDKLPTPELLVTLAWCKGRCQLNRAMELILKDRVPPSEVRKIISILSYGDKQEPRLQQFIQLTKDLNINVQGDHWRYMTNWISSVDSDWANFLRRLQVANEIGYGKRNLVAADKLIARCGEDIARELFNVFKDRTRKSTVVAGVSIPIDLDLGDAIDYLRETLDPERARRRPRVPNSILKFNRPDKITPYHWSALPKIIGEWGLRDSADEYTIWMERGVSPKTYLLLAALLRWDASFINQIKLNDIDAALYPLSPNQIRTIAAIYRSKHVIEKPTSSAEAKSIVRRLNDICIRAFPGPKTFECRLGNLHAVVNIHEHEDFESTRINTVLRIRLHPGNTTKLAYTQGHNPYGFAQISRMGDDIVVQCLQFDSYRSMPEDLKAQYADWKEIYLKAVTLWAKANGFKRILIETGSGVMRRYGVLDNTSAKHIVEVYNEGPKRQGYKLIRLREKFNIADESPAIWRTGEAGKYLWVKVLDEKPDISTSFNSWQRAIDEGENDLAHILFMKWATAPIEDSSEAQKKNIASKLDCYRIALADLRVDIAYKRFILLEIMNMTPVTPEERRRWWRLIEKGDLKGEVIFSKNLSAKIKS